LNSNDDAHQQTFLERIAKVREHLGMVFHRLIGDGGDVEILINNRPVFPWDPFVETGPVTSTPSPQTPLKFEGEQVMVQGYVLPHHSRITKAVIAEASGPFGWNAHQGFYVYRNRRLLVPGDWLGFGWAKEEHYKLARIRIDIPNSTDGDWKIDVTKSHATPPRELLEALKRIGERVRSDAKRVYSFRGARISEVNDSQRVLLWLPMKRRGKTFYKLNEAHPLVAKVKASSTDQKAFSAFIRLIEETLPAPQIFIDAIERPEEQRSPFDGVSNSQIQPIITELFKCLLDSGLSEAEALGRLPAHWPFEKFPELIQLMKESRSHADV
jgi:hypothetical protein